MKLLLNESWEDFKETAQEKQLVLFGASSCADLFLNKLNIKIDIKYLIDNDPNKHGKLFDGKYQIKSPEELEKEGENGILCITSEYYNEIIEQLKKMEYKGKVYSYQHLRKKAVMVCDNKENDIMEQNVERLKKILFDQKSIDIVNKIVGKRKKNNRDYSDIYEENQYFVKDIINREKDEVFVDGGSYNGDTIDEFIEFTNNRFKKIYAFEMDKDNLNMIVKSKYDDRVQFCNYGLWNENTILHFAGNGSASELIEDGAEEAKCVKLDDYVTDKVSFIKMDIEGAEMKALQGGKRIIKRDCPKLAICLYHKYSDLWEIPFYIHELVPEYKLYIRHHSKNYEETVLYAVV